MKQLTKTERKTSFSLSAIRTWISSQNFLDVMFYILVLAAILCFTLIHPENAPPDETNHYLVAKYIFNHGTLPIGSDPEIAIYGYGASYAYQPILSYIFMGFFMRLVGLFTDNQYFLLIAARLINVTFGVLMAYYVRRISKELFASRLTQWFFTLMIVFLPQNLFLHSYVNTDSMAALGCAMIFYGIICGMKDSWRAKTSIQLSIGIIFCAMSYYNSYSIILSAIVLFFFSFFIKEDGVILFDTRNFLKKGLFISVIVLAGIGWWFIRNYFLYDGDFIGLAARKLNAIATSTDDYNPLSKPTFQNTGKSLLYMFKETEFVSLLSNSFIGYFGIMNIMTEQFIYYGTKIICLIGALFFFFPSKENTLLIEFGKKRTILFHLMMILHIAVVLALCIFYSYAWDYQPQGRYILPILVPMMYFVVTGYTKLFHLLKTKLSFGSRISVAIQIICIIFFIVSVYISIFTRFIPYYEETGTLLDLIEISLS